MTWQMLPIKNFGRIITGKTPPTAKTEFFGEAYPFITPTDINGEQRKVITSRFLSSEGEKFQRTLLLPPNTICVVCIGATIGKLCVTNKPSFTNQQINSIVVNQSEHDALFVYYALKLKSRDLISRAGGAATPILNKSSFSEVTIATPPLETQQRIAAVLSAYDDLIENNAQRVQILEELAQRIYEEWFVRLRFPGHENAKMIECELGLIPRGWSVTTLDKVATINRLSIGRGNEPTHIFYVDIASVSTGKIDNVNRFLFTEAPGRARRIVRHGDIIWSNVRPNRKSFALIINPPQNMIVSTGFTVISAASVPYSFLYHALTTEDFTSYLTNRAKGAAYPAVGSEDFANAKLIIPSLELLSTFNEVAEPMQMEKDLLLKKNAVLNRTRDLLLPKLISGEIDVYNFPEPETN